MSSLTAKVIRTETTTDGWGRKHTTKVIECQTCGKELLLDDPLTNVCECGQYYNGCGQRLAPPSQWEERMDEDY